LGAGTLAAYGKTSDYFRFYEINPQMVGIAKNYFSYLRDSPAHIDIVLGDARLSLESEAPQQFDVLAVDAFSGDAIPVHLLTREAFAVYLRHLKPDGILAVHTSNTYLNLPPVVELLAEDAGCEARMIINDDDHRKLIDSSDWVLVTRNWHFLDAIDGTVLSEPISVPPNLRVWSDDFNNLFQILRPVKFKQSSPR
jgi:SAM-dependent methyltransferase